jgi:hypothetical protein
LECLFSVVEPEREWVMAVRAFILDLRDALPAQHHAESGDPRAIKSGDLKATKSRDLRAIKTVLRRSYYYMYEPRRSVGRWGALTRTRR